MTLPERVRLTGDLFHPIVPEGAVRVDRTTRWGNRHKVMPHGIHTIEESLYLFREELLGRTPTTTCDCKDRPRPTADAVRQELAGKNLACWCRIGAPCHGQILVEIANSDAPAGAPGQEPAAPASKPDRDQNQSNQSSPLRRPPSHPEEPTP